MTFRGEVQKDWSVILLMKSVLCCRVGSLELTAGLEEATLETLYYTVGKRYIFLPVFITIGHFALSLCWDHLSR